MCVCVDLFCVVYGDMIRLPGFLNLTHTLLLAMTMTMAMAVVTGGVGNK